MRTSVWKATTAVALGLAGLLAFRPLRAQSQAAPAPAASPVATVAATPGQGAPAPQASRSDALVARLAATRGADDACEVLDSLGWQGDATATAALVETLGARATSTVKACALSALGHVPGDAATDALLEASHSPQAVVRDAALAAMATRDDEMSRATVVAVARSSDVAARVSAAVALAGARVPGAATLIDELLPTATTAQQQRLLASLGQTGDPAALPALARYALAPSSEVRSAVVGAAARAGGAALPLVDDAIRRGGDDADAALAALGGVDTPDARGRLIQAADDPRPPVAAKALEELAPFDGEDVRAAVVMHVGSPHAAVATAAARWLAVRGDGAAVASLVEASQRTDSSSADEAMSLLGGLDSQAALSAMISLASRPGVARERALRELVGTPGGGEQARAIALRMMRDEGGSVASTGLNLLSGDASPQATQALAEVARGGGPLANDAATALGTRKDEASLAALVELARTGGVDSARNAAITSLGGTHDPRAVRVLVDAASDPLARDAALASLARTGGPDAERALAHAAESGNAEERAAVARALTGETPAAMVPRLATLARDPDANVSDAAFQALRTAAPQDALAVATEGMRSADPAARAASVARAGELDAEVARPVLLQAMHDRDPDVVTAAAGQLANAGGADAQQALLDVLTASSSNDDVRRAAAEALQSMGGAAARDHADLIAKWVDTGEGDDESGSP